MMRCDRQPLLSSTIEVEHLCLFGYIAEMDDHATAKKILAALLLPGRPCITWLKSVVDDLKLTTSHSLKQSVAVETEAVSDAIGS